MMGCNYLQGDLFERFYSNNLLRPSYISWSIQFNCALCALTQWSSVRCGWWMEQRLRTVRSLVYLWQYTVWCQNRAAFPHHSCWVQSFVCPSVYGFLKTKTVLSRAQCDHQLPWRRTAAGTDGVLGKLVTGWIKRTIYLPRTIAFALTNVGPHFTNYIFKKKSLFIYISLTLLKKWGNHLLRGDFSFKLFYLSKMLHKKTKKTLMKRVTTVHCPARLPTVRAAIGPLLIHKCTKCQWIASLVAISLTIRPC